MSDYPIFTWTPLIVVLHIVFGAAFGAGMIAGRVTAVPTISTMEAVIDRLGMRWNDADMKRYCQESGYMHPPWDAYLAGAEVLPARDGADVGTLICYWRLKR